jgi:hypothetical protein
VSVTANAIISPDGTQNADKILESASNVQQWAYQSPSMTGAQTATIYAKKGERNYIAMATAGLDPSYFNLDTGVVVSTASGATASITSVGNGWYRCSVSSASIVGGTFYIVWISYDGVNRSYAGDPSKGVYVWGAQNEASSYPTSYIPTTSSSATRVADAIGNQTTSIAQAFTDNTKGTIFFDLKNIKFAGGAEARFRFGNTADALQFAFFMDSVGLGVYGYQGGGYAVNVSTATNQKIAIRFDGTSLTGFSQGVKRNTVTAGTNYVIEQMVGNDTGNLCLEINEFVLFNSVLTDAECIALTTL